MTEASPETGYLDAARACILAVGWRRTTLTDIARRAGVSRMTIYRRWPDMATLLGDLLVREWSGLLLESGMLSDEERSTRQQITRGVATMASLVRDNVLFRRIVEVDPELLHPYLFQRRGRNQTWMLEILQEYLRTGQSGGSVRAGDPVLLARTVLLSAYGFVLSGPTMTDGTVTAESLTAELEAMVDRYLRP